MRHRFVLFCLAAIPALASFYAPPVHAQSEAASLANQELLAELLTKAETQATSTKPTWRRLLHIPNGSNKSVIDDPEFFLHPKGQTHPDLELQATLEAFYAPIQGPVDGTNELITAVCRFVARYHWLRDELGIDPQTLPHSDCAIFDAVRKELDPGGATIAFAAGHMNSPASMFGHTLLVIDSKSKGRILSKAVNYAADTAGGSGLVFAFRGILGGYKGRFSVLPYYDKVAEYSEISQRDMWEYPITLTEPEMTRLLEHTWELQHKFGWYYFFTENCSYNLLHLINAARPDLDLTHGFNLYTLPVDTVRRLGENQLLSEVVYRPSKATEMLHQSSLLNEADRALSLEVANQRVEPATVTNRFPAANSNTAARARAILDLAAALQKNKYTEQILSPAEYRKAYIKTLRVRSKLGRATESESDSSVPTPLRPDLAHPPSQLGVFAGTRDGDAFVGLRTRLLFHDLLDPPQGYPNGAHIAFGEAILRYQEESQELQIERLTAFEVLSLSPRNELFRPWSWSVHLGLRRIPGLHELASSAAYARGLSYDVGGVGQAYFLAGVQGHSDVDDHHQLGPQAEIGWASHSSSLWRQKIWGRVSQELVGGDDRYYEAGIEHRLHLKQGSLAISLSYDAAEQEDSDAVETSLSWLITF